MQSKWETVDPEDVEAQAMTTSKWETLENANLDGEPLDGEPLDDVNLDGVPLAPAVGTVASTWLSLK